MSETNYRRKAVRELIERKSSEEDVTMSAFIKDSSNFELATVQGGQYSILCR